MASAEDLSVLEDELTCAVCLQLYRDPHLLQCGHNFCLSCLQQLKSSSDHNLRCPECRQNHLSSVTWQKNFKLAGIADSYRSRSQPQLPSRKSSKVRCHYCPPETADTDGNSTAVKTCLKCEVSMCSEHLKPHLELPAFREHPLVEPLGDMKTRKCPEHDEMFRYYCLDERILLCNACTVEEGHKGHSIKTLKNAMKDMKVSLDTKLQKANKKIRRVEKNMEKQKEMERENKDFLEALDHKFQVLREALSSRLESVMASLQGCVQDFHAEQDLSVQNSLARITEDHNRLDNVHTGIQQPMEENDPFQFIKEYLSCAKRYRQILRRPLFVEDSEPRDPENLEESVEGHLEEFMTDVNNLIETFGKEDNSSEDNSDDSSDDSSEDNSDDSSDDSSEDNSDDSSEDNSSDDNGSDEDEEKEEEMSGNENTGEDSSVEFKNLSLN